jgi:peptidoglycan/LPS O-acetylase OafA/YrhL
MLVSVQYLRALAAAMVLLHHVAWKGSQYGSDPLAWFKFGSAGVDLFFIISGYIMCEATDGRRVDFTSFMKARFFRIVPLYWLLSLVALAAFLLWPSKVNSSGGSTDVLYSFLLWPSADKYLIQNGWTLSYEFLFYGLFALGLGFGRHRYVIAISVVVAMVLAGRVFEPSGVWGAFLTNAILLEFVMGIAAFHLFKQGFRANAGLSILLATVAITGFCFAGELNTGVSRVIGYGLPSLALFVAVRALEGRTGSFDRSLAGKVAGALGDSSYSMYLAHPFFLVAAAALMAKSGMASNGWLLITILFIGSLATGWYCHILLEKPMTKLIARARRSSSLPTQSRTTDLKSAAIRGTVTASE